MRLQLGLGVLLVLFATTAIFTLPAPAHASEEDDARARQLYRNGERLYEEGLYEEAIAAWERAYDLSSRAELLYNIANALERIGRWEEALDRLNQYRAFADADEQEVLERRMRSIERRIEEKEALDDEAARLAAEKDRRRPVSSRVGANPSGEGPHPAGIALIGLGAAGLATGGVFGGLALEARAEALEGCQEGSEGVLCKNSVADALSRDSRFSLGADVGVIGGAAALGAGIVITLVHQSRSDSARANRVLIVPSGGPTSASLLVTGRF